MANKPQKKLWVCSVSIGMMVYAETAEEAGDIAADCIEDEVGQAELKAADFIVTDAGSGRRKVYADGWKGGEYPYGSDDKTVTEIFEELDRKAWP